MIGYHVIVLYDASIKINVQIMVRRLINADSRGAQSNINMVYSITQQLKSMFSDVCYHLTKFV